MGAAMHFLHHMPCLGAVPLPSHIADLQALLLGKCQASRTRRMLPHSVLSCAQCHTLETLQSLVVLLCADQLIIPLPHLRAGSGRCSTTDLPELHTQ